MERRRACLTLLSTHLFVVGNTESSGDTESSRGACGVEGDQG